MGKDFVIPPIKGNVKRGELTENDAAVQWGGSKPKAETVIAKEKPQRKKRVVRKKTKQKSFSIKNLEQLKELSTACGVSEAAVVNFALARLAKEILK